MALTLRDILSRLAQLDEITLLEVLQINIFLSRQPLLPPPHPAGYFAFLCVGFYFNTPKAIWALLAFGFNI